jgi:hypothetical protein
LIGADGIRETRKGRKEMFGHDRLPNANTLQN